MRSLSGLVGAHWLVHQPIRDRGGRQWVVVLSVINDESVIKEISSFHYLKNSLTYLRLKQKNNGKSLGFESSGD